MLLVFSIKTSLLLNFSQKLTSLKNVAYKCVAYKKKWVYVYKNKSFLKFKEAHTKNDPFWDRQFVKDKEMVKIWFSMAEDRLTTITNLLYRKLAVEKYYKKSRLKNLYLIFALLFWTRLKWFAFWPKMSCMFISGKSRPELWYYFKYFFIHFLCRHRIYTCFSRWSPTTF